MHIKNVSFFIGGADQKSVLSCAEVAAADLKKEDLCQNVLAVLALLSRNSDPPKIPTPQLG